MENQLINRVANSGIITINLEDYYPKEEILVFDIKDYLFKELILKEKDFRASLKILDWDVYKDKIVLIQCSADAIIPTWSYMLICSNLSGVAKDIFEGNKEAYLRHYYKTVIGEMNVENFEQKRVVIKGCGDIDIPNEAYVSIVNLLKPKAQSIMFGEPCSTVPVFKRPRTLSQK